MKERVEITFNEYVVEAQRAHANNLTAWSNEILNAMDRIKRRLGNMRHQEVCEIFKNAVHEQIKSGLLDAHKEWIEYLLKEYYDPMYDYQIQKRADQVMFRGSKEEIVGYLSELTSASIR